MFLFDAKKKKKIYLKKQKVTIMVFHIYTGSSFQVVVTPLVYYRAFLAKWLRGKIDTIHRLGLLLLSLPLWGITRPFWQSGYGVKLTQFTIFVCCCCRYVYVYYKVSLDNMDPG